ncbi:inactive leucine-rich repeat receptor-like serine/threonine-protein kinase At1g60630 [Phragmites australis]|uniref:inactive leucine-rich repeat receptor-like serine/threonine-protein kinase At1g60630 n=1 Tax=Phragmites australis TaxID=29695 RepID=UPI002D7830C9|nr:inactive leucine-rich repeat receptor-like serine/threonine-protein kinase At1g60630 [Phragmites australis]
MPSRRTVWPFFLLLLLLLPHLAHLAAGAGDADSLLAFKSSLDHSDRLPWRPDTAPSFCSSWPGVRQCGHGSRVTKLVLEGLNLTGSLTAALLAPLAELRVLSLKSNALSGPIPDALPRALPNLKLLYLADNRLQGRIPASLALLHRATVIVLSSNRLTGEIPGSLATVPRLTSLLLDGNLLTGAIPPLPQRTLRLLNVSSNRLSGQIPAVLARRFNASSFLPNAGLCGPPLPTRCLSVAAPGPAPFSAATAAFAPLPSPISSSRRGKNAAIVAGATVAGAVVLGILVAAAVMASRRGRNKRVAGDVDKGGGGGAMPMPEEEQQQQQPQTHDASAVGGGGREFSWEREGIGKLVFCGGVTEMYSLEELLRASAETLGRGEVGSTYKAVMETGFIVTVKRMREPSAGGEFGRRAEELGRVRHPNVVAVRAYFQAKEERLLVYDYYPNGSLFSLLHGSRPSSKGKPLHWTSCLKIAEDVAAGLLHLHQQPSPPGAGIVHGNLKPTNVLLGPDFESCLTDYGLVPTLLPSDADLHSSSSSSLLYRAPEVRAAHASPASFTPASDVYSLGVLLLELLTGRTPFQDLMELHGDDIPSWVRAVREEERETESGGDSVSAGGAEEKLTALIGIAAACVAADPARRPTTPEVLRMVREARAEAMSSSNSSDRSPARWSDAMLGAPRDRATESFTDRD